MPGYGFPRKLRLTNAAGFRSVFNQANLKVSNRELLILARINSLDHARLGLVIGKKNLPRANRRNRLKRVLRNSFRLNQDLLAGLDIVILARNSFEGLDNRRVSENVQQLWLDLVRKSSAGTHTPMQK